MRFTLLLRIICAILFVSLAPIILTGGESLTTWGYLHIGGTGADTSNGLYLRNYMAIRSDEVQFLHQNPSIYFIDISASTKAWISDAGNFPTPESMGDDEISLIDWEDNPETVDHMGYYSVINDTIWDPSTHAVMQFNDCILRAIPVPDTISAVTQVELIWNKPVEDIGVPETTNIIGYNVYRGHDGINFPLRLNAGIVPDTFFTDNTAFIGDSIYYYAIKLVYRGTPDTIESQQFSANSPMIKADSDIGILSIDSPADSIEPDSIEPIISIKNTGAATPCNFYVKCRIDSLSTSVYSESLLVDSLLPDSSLALVFSYWHPGSGGNSYVVNGLNLLSGDADPSNDTLSKTVIIYAHDVGIDSLISPGDTIGVGSPLNPAVTVKNFGNTDEDFPVFCYIDSAGSIIYGETLLVNILKPDSIQPLSFPSWTPLAEGDYTFYFITQLTGDANSANDTLIFSTYAAGIEEDSDKKNPVPMVFALYQNFPNPFTTSTTISFNLPNAEGIRQSAKNRELKIYDVNGRMIKSFSLPTACSLFPTKITWDGRDERGKEVPSGLYFYTLKTGNRKITKNIIKLK